MVHCERFSSTCPVLTTLRIFNSIDACDGAPVPSLPEELTTHLQFLVDRNLITRARNLNYQFKSRLLLHAWRSYKQTHESAVTNAEVTARKAIDDARKSIDDEKKRRQQALEFEEKQRRDAIEAIELEKKRRQQALEFEEKQRRHATAKSALEMEDMRRDFELKDLEREQKLEKLKRSAASSTQKYPKQK